VTLTLRDRIAEAIGSVGHRNPSGDVRLEPGTAADAALAVVQPEIDMLRRALGEIRGDIGKARAILGQHDCAAGDPSERAQP